MHPHEPECGGGDDQPKAVDHERAHDERGEKAEGRPEIYRPIELGQGNDQDNGTDNDIHQRPQTELADTDEKLGISRLGKGVIERPFADFVHEALHVRLDGSADHSPGNGEDSHHSQQVGFAPAAELVHLLEDKAQTDQPGAERNEGLQDLNVEIGAVLEFVQDSNAQVIECEFYALHINLPPPRIDGWPPSKSG